jgi:response regulator RpfG family c-di-GMP phosphodiesterase
VVTAEDGEAGLTVLRARPFDLVLSDHCMPGMGGLDLLAHARAIQPESLRVLMTAHPEMDLVLRGKNEVLLQRFLTKPFRPKEVVAVVQELLAQRRGHLLKEQAFQRSMALVQRRMDALAGEPAGALRGA